MLNPQSGPLTPESQVDEILKHYPSTGPIFLQCGRRDVLQQRPDQTLGEYARLGGVAIERLLELLNAAAEAEQFAQRTAGPFRAGEAQSGRRERTPPVGSVGYTGSYRERGGDIVDVSVVSVLEARGPE
jgi:hypothetical protein